MNNNWRAQKDQKTQKPPVFTQPVFEIVIDQQTDPETECKMDKLGGYITLEIERNEIKEINVHGKVREIRPGDLVKSSMREPELGNSQMMNQGITRNGRCKI
jgi:hypothetical protein